MDRYVANTWHNFPETKLRVARYGLSGSFTIYTRYANYFVKYYCVGHGIIKYEYSSEAVTEQILEDLSAVVMIGTTAAVFYLSGGTVWVPAFA